MMDIYTKALNDYLTEASSSSPTPGGGNVSAVVAALGGSMIAMVANLTLGKKGYEKHQDETRLLIGKRRFSIRPTA